MGNNQSIGANPELRGGGGGARSPTQHQHSISTTLSEESCQSEFRPRSKARFRWLLKKISQTCKIRLLQSCIGSCIECMGGKDPSMRGHSCDYARPFLQGKMGKCKACAGAPAGDSQRVRTSLAACEHVPGSKGWSSMHDSHDTVVLQYEDSLC